jgi:hypothetical protein
MMFADDVGRQAKVIPASRVKAGCAQMLIIINRVWKVLTRAGRRDIYTQVPAISWFKVQLGSFVG